MGFSEQRVFSLGSPSFRQAPVVAERLVAVDEEKHLATSFSENDLRRDFFSGMFLELMKRNTLQECKVQKIKVQEAEAFAPYSRLPRFTQRTDSRNNQ